MADISALQEALGERFIDLSRLETALVHSSYANENPAIAAEHNERLEFLGDAILGFVVARELYRGFPALDEGEMTRRRAVLVSRESLAGVARAIRLGDYLFLGRGEEASGGRDKSANLAGALEAVIAAVYLDRGEEAGSRLVLRLLGEEIAAMTRRGSRDIDYKSRLQELIQSRYQTLPAYRLTDETGPAHEKTFSVEVMAGAGVLGRGTGRSKKLAEAAAARAALEGMRDGFTD